MSHREFQDNLAALGGNPDSKTKDKAGEEQAKVEKQELKLSFLDYQHKLEDLKGKSQDREQRLEYSRKIYGFLCVYFGGILVLLLLSGFRLGDFLLSDGVLMMLLGTTTANVIALFAIVPKYLFSK